MPGIFEREPGKRWPRSQKFRLSSRGAEAEASYQHMINGAKEGEGRNSFDAARQAWSAPLSLLPNDGLFLVELRGAPLSIEEMTRALEPCGTTKREIKEAIDRLSTLGIIEPVPA